MILDSDDDARKIVQSVLRADEELVWAQRPRIVRILCSCPIVLILSLAVMFCISGLFSQSYLNPLVAWQYRDYPTMLYGQKIFQFAIGACLLFFGLAATFSIANYSVYGITTKRVLVVGRKKHQIHSECEGKEIVSVSVRCNQSGHGSVLIQTTHGPRLYMDYLNRVPAVASMVASEHKTTFEEANFSSKAMSSIFRYYFQTLDDIYWCVGEKNGLMAALKSVGWWLFYLIMLWIFNGTFACAKDNHLVFPITIFGLFTITLGLIIRLKKCCTNQ